MKTSLILCYIRDPWFLKKIAFNAGTFDRMIRTKIDLCIFTKSTWILISYSFTISKCLENGVTSKYLRLNRKWMILIVTQIGKHLHTIFSWLCLACSRLSRYDNGLFLNLVDHTLISSTCNCINMRHFDTITFKNSISDILNNGRSIKILHIFIGVEGYERRSNRRINLIFLISLNKIIKNAILAKLSHKTHIVICFIHIRIY